MRRTTTTLATAMAVLAIALASAGGAIADPGARSPAGTDAAAPAGEPQFAPGEVIVRFRDGGERTLELPDGVGVKAAAAALASNRRVAYATPNYIAHAAAASGTTTNAGFIPNDPGVAGVKGGWQGIQWNFLPCGSICAPGTTTYAHQSRGGIDAPRAWATMRRLGRPGGAGVKVAVLDTGVAYRALRPKTSKSPDFKTSQFTPGFDFVDNDTAPVDEDGHGTHVAGTIAEQTGNGKSVTGIAYGAKVMPVRVLDDLGEGKSGEIGAGIIYAANHGAKVINMSFEFGSAVRSCKDVKSVCRGVRYANRKGVSVIAAVGNDYDSGATFPARIPGVIGVGGSTEGGCVADYSNIGADVDLFAPGGQGEGGSPCHSADGPIFQLTYMGNDRHRFGLPTDYVGTSMAAAHVSGVAALIIASGELGASPSPARVQCQLSLSARQNDLGEPYVAARWGAGLINAGRAVAGALC